MTGLTANDIGVAATTMSEVSAEHAWRVASVLDADDDLTDGRPLPLLWHWAFFTPPVPTAELGLDGHPSLPGDGPTAGLPRRMWAGGRIRTEAPLLVGRPAIRRSEVVSAERKSGRSGDLLVVTARHRVEQDGRTVLTEEQDLIYRQPPSTPMPMPVPDPSMGADERGSAAAGGWSERFVADPVTLFRYSAVTFNSHRIHYDPAYAIEEEGYPGLVVHGPLTATLLAESARRRGRSAMAPASFEFRAAAPLFGGVPFTLIGRPDGTGVGLTAVRNDSTVAMTARLA